MASSYIERTKINGVEYSKVPSQTQLLNDFETLPTTYIYSMPNKAQFNYYYNRGEAECSLFLLNAYDK